MNSKLAMGTFSFNKPKFDEEGSIVIERNGRIMPFADMSKACFLMECMGIYQPYLNELLSKIIRTKKPEKVSITNRSGEESFITVRFYPKGAVVPERN